MALELARDDPAYEDMASKFFEHFVAIADAMNTLGGTGLWDEEDGFYYDQLHVDGATHPAARPLAGRASSRCSPSRCSSDDVIDRLPGFTQAHAAGSSRTARTSRAHISYMERAGEHGHGHRLLAIPSRERLERVLRYVLDENEFLSPYGIRSLSRVHREQPVRASTSAAQEHRVDYAPGESDTGLFGGNSNWRGPVWFPLNYLLIEALERYHHFYGDDAAGRVPDRLGPHDEPRRGRARARRAGSPRSSCPTRTAAGPATATTARYRDDPHWRDLVLVPRVLPRRHRPRPRREPPDRLDRAWRSAASRTWHDAKSRTTAKQGAPRSTRVAAEEMTMKAVAIFPAPAR